MVKLKKLSLQDGEDIYEMLQEIPAEENNMHNKVNGMKWDEYKEFLAKLDEESKIEGLIDGWKVPFTRYWLYVDDQPVGIGDIRHFLTDALKNAGGNIGYAIKPTERGKGYGNKILELLLKEAKGYGMDKALITILPGNIASRKVAMANGGIILRENRDDHIRIWVPLVDYSNVQLETKELILRKAKSEDWESMYNNLWKHEESAKYMLWEPTKDKDEAKERMIRTINFQKVEKYTFCIYLKGTGEVIGHAGMRDESDGLYSETGIAIGPSFIRKGYGRQVLNALTDEAKSMGATRFLASDREKNIASCELQKACGFMFDHLSEEKTDPRTGEKYFVEYNIKIL